MDFHIKDFYHKSSEEPSKDGDKSRQKGCFHSVIVLTEAPDIDLNELQKRAPQLPKGWCELAQLSVRDRIDFTHDFWQLKLPYQEEFSPFIDKFFSNIEDIAIFLTQKTETSPYEVDMVYCLKGGDSFYRGSPPITPSNKDNLINFFSAKTLPCDYLSFLHIHDGFCKTTDSTGIIRSADMPAYYEKFTNSLMEKDPIFTSQGNMLDPKTLIPFYESFGMPFYQCFWSEWYPQQEMGNVYYSGKTNTISDVYLDETGSSSMGFPLFIDWLKFYLEKVV